MNKEQAEPWPPRDESSEEKPSQAEPRPNAAATLMTCSFESRYFFLPAPHAFFVGLVSPAGTSDQVRTNSLDKVQMAFASNAAKTVVFTVHCLGFVIYDSQSTSAN